MDCVCIHIDSRCVYVIFMFHFVLPLHRARHRERVESRARQGRQTNNYESFPLNVCKNLSWHYCQAAFCLLRARLQVCASLIVITNVRLIKSMITDLFISLEACAAIKYVRTSQHTHTHTDSHKALDKQQMASMKWKQIAADKGKQNIRQFKLLASNCCSIYFLYKQCNHLAEQNTIVLRMFHLLIDIWKIVWKVTRCKGERNQWSATSTQSFSRDTLPPHCGNINKFRQLNKSVEGL